jgi:hypothetical protein
MIGEFRMSIVNRLPGTDGVGEWMVITCTLEPRRLVGGTLVDIAGIIKDTRENAQLTVDWLNDRAAGYPNLAKFEGGANWPLMPYPIEAVKCSACEGASGPHRTGISHCYA